MTKEFKVLIEMAKDRQKLAESNPAIDVDLLRKWAVVHAGATRAPKRYQLQRAFEDTAEAMARQVQARAKLT